MWGSQAKSLASASEDQSLLLDTGTKPIFGHVQPTFGNGPLKDQTLINIATDPILGIGPPPASGMAWRGETLGREEQMNLRKTLTQNLDIYSPLLLVSLLGRWCLHSFRALQVFRDLVSIIIKLIWPNVDTRIYPAKDYEQIPESRFLRLSGSGLSKGQTFPKNIGSFPYVHFNSGGAFWHD